MRHPHLRAWQPRPAAPDRDVPDVVAEQTLGTVQGHPAHAPDDVVSVAFDGHMLLGGVAVEARLLAPADDLSHVA